MRLRAGWVQGPHPPPLPVFLFSGLLARPSLCKRNCSELRDNFAGPEMQASFFTWCSAKEQRAACSKARSKQASCVGRADSVSVG